MNYYNEYDKKTAAWLRELVKAGLIPKGDVDERSISEVKPSDLVGYTQCHFFAGIGGWPYALQLAGWSADRPVWTGSCPCQPFSTAGKGLGQADERHLWPVFFRLIKECRPDCVFGEQVEGAIGKGWLDGVQRDLEGEGYAVGHCVLGAHSVGSPHIRQRLYWVADAKGRRHEGYDVQSLRRERATTGHESHAPRSSAVGGVADFRSQGLEGHRRPGEEPVSGEWQRTQRHCGQGGAVGGVGNTNGSGREARSAVPCGVQPLSGEFTDASADGRMADSDSRGRASGVYAGSGTAATRGRQGDTLSSVRVDGVSGSGSARMANAEDDNGWSRKLGAQTRTGANGERGRGPASSGWSDFRVILCRDGKHRRIPAEPAFFPLADGVPARVVRLRGYGNAIVPQVAAAFVAAYLG